MTKNDRAAMKEFGKRLDERIKWKGIKKKHLAIDLGIKSSQITTWTNGLAYPRIVTLIRLSEMLNVSIDFLLTGKEKKRGLFD